MNKPRKVAGGAEELRYRPDPADPEGHGLVEPSRMMGFEEYLAAIQATRALWRRVEP